MSARLLNGQSHAKLLEKQLEEEIASYVQQGLRAPTLAVILVGEDPASHIYVRNKQAACLRTGIQTRSLKLPPTLTEKELLTQIRALNEDPTVDGILVQLPLPDHINSAMILESLHPDKDVDGFHPYNLGRLAQRRPLFRPCTPYGILLLLEAYGISLQGLDATVIGTSTIVGLPMFFELLMAGATPTLCHRQTQDLPEKVNRADVLVVAAGHPHLIQGSWIKENAIVIDVGINRNKDGKLVGDVDFIEAQKKAAFITPVPGGVGPMTVAVLLKNTLQAYKMQQKMNVTLNKS